MTTLAIIQNVGIPQLLIILVVVLIIFGPKALPQLGRSLGRGLREFRSAADKATDLLTEEEEREKQLERERKAREADPVHREKDEAPVSATADKK
ncbi:MAG: twin-arginine translocase TatA/TatE family subunit [Candidatus Sumerlaeia bacterium]|nr:twin-arginine translocase TatA/TatE family subunit [Candidatus Sumerlaeia bacterium]